MATSRAFGILNNQNIVAGNHQPFGKSVQASKSGETRPGAFALKDLTNKNQRTNVQPNGGRGKSNENALKAKTSSLLQKLNKDFAKPTPARKPQQHSKASDDIFSPHHVEYAWSKASCLRDDLLDQMLDLPEMEREPLRNLPKATRSDLLDLPDLDVAWDYYAPASYSHRSSVPKPLDLPADDFPMVDIQDLEFIF